MKLRNLQSIAAAAACLGMLASPAAAAAPRAQGQLAPTADVALAEGGVLMGQVVDAQGTALAGQTVSIHTGGREVARVATNNDGVFAASGLKGGVYEVAAADHRGVYRVWSPRTAPPSANRGIMAVAGKDAVRAQYAPPQQPGVFGKTMHWISNHPFLTAGIVATAIAVPLALDGDDDDPTS